MAGCDKVRKGARAQAWLLVPLGLVVALSLVLSNVYYWLLPGADVFYELPWYLSVFGDELSAQWLFNGAFLAAFGWGVSRVYLALVEAAAVSRQRGSGASSSSSESRGGLLGLITAHTAASLEADEARARSAAEELLAEEEAAAAAKAAAAAAQRKPAAARAGATKGSSSAGAAPKPPKAAAGAAEACTAAPAKTL